MTQPRRELPHECKPQLTSLDTFSATTLALFSTAASATSSSAFVVTSPRALPPFPLPNLAIVCFRRSPEAPFFGAIDGMSGAELPRPRGVEL